MPSPSPLRTWWRAGVVVLALLCVGALAPAYADSRELPSPIGQDPFVVGHRYAGDFPDPSVLRVGTRYYAYGTSTAGLNLPVLTSHTLSAWWATGPAHDASPDALPAVPSWAWHQSGRPGKGMVWAPTVAHWKGRYVMAYAVRKRARTFTMCISTATSASPRGPFVDHTTKPLVCPADRGAIDPMFYREAGRSYLLYKTEDITIGRPTRLWIRQVSTGGRAFAEPRAHLLLTADQPWEGDVVEAPAMITYASHRYLFFSANGWASPRYATGYAVCDTVDGPCRLPSVPAPVATDPPVTSPLLVSTGDVVGPGGASPIVGGSGRLRLVYHAWSRGAAHYPSSTTCRTRPAGCGQRRLHAATLAVAADGTLSVADYG